MQQDNVMLQVNVTPWDNIRAGLACRPLPSLFFWLPQEAEGEQGAPGPPHPSTLPRTQGPLTPCLPTAGAEAEQAENQAACAIAPRIKNPINSGAAASSTTPPRRLRGGRFGSGLIPPPLVLSFQFLPQTPECLGLHTREFTPREQSLISALCAGQGCFTPPSITLLDLIPSLMPLGRGL